MAKNLVEASDNYVELVKKVANECGIGQYIEMKVFNMLKSTKEVIKVKKTSEPMEVALEGEDMVDVYIYEEAFDLVDEETQKFWIENALCQVAYDLEKSRLVFGKEPKISLPIGIYDRYKDFAVQKLQLAALTLQQIADKKKQEKQERKSKKKF